MTPAIAADRHYLARALELAARARGLTSPNPLVGAVVVRNGKIMGEGYHHRAGDNHAEVEALHAAGERARGATLYVTLEPCVHHGRTPPCVPSILAAGICRVVISIRDPNPKVAGRGIEALRKAGCEVTLGVMEEEARALNRQFFTYMLEHRPFVTLKAAMTLDGKIAAWDRSSRWITGEMSRREAHRMRAESDAVVVGIGTVLQDDPELSVRLSEPWPREPYRVVVDSSCRTPVEAKLLSSGAPDRTLIATTGAAPDERVAALEARGARVVRLPSRDGRVDLQALAAHLADREMTALLLEGGSELSAAFLEDGLVDRVALFFAPMIVGGAHAPTAVGGHGRSLKEAFRLREITSRPIGDDILIEGELERGMGNV